MENLEQRSRGIGLVGRSPAVTQRRAQGSRAGGGGSVKAVAVLGEAGCWCILKTELMYNTCQRSACGM